MTRYSRRRALRLAAVAGAGVVMGTAAQLVRVLWSLVQPQRVIMPPMPVIVSRDRWGARPPDHKALNERGFAKKPLGDGWYVYPDLLPDVYNTVVIHHSAQPLDSSQTINDLQNLHMNFNHWADIGYHFAIDRNGEIFEGRSLHVRGASVAGHNTGVMGVVLMGNFEDEIPEKDQLIALQSLVNWLAVTYTLTHLAGHGEFNPQSVCPGRNMLPFLDVLAYGAGLQRGTGGYVAPPE